MNAARGVARATMSPVLGGGRRLSRAPWSVLVGIPEQEASTSQFSRDSYAALSANRTRNAAQCQILAEQPSGLGLSSRPARATQTPARNSAPGVINSPVIPLADLLVVPPEGRLGPGQAALDDSELRVARRPHHPPGRGTIPAMRYTCQVCGAKPATVITSRHHVGMIVRRRSPTTSGLRCVDRTRRQLTADLASTLLLGWWGAISLFINGLFIVPSQGPKPAPLISRRHS